MSELKPDPKNMPTETVDEGIPPADWIRDLQTESMTEWERLPDIGLYMDQVLTLVERQLSTYRRGGEDRMVTAAMVNNYIKDGLVPRAESKKYAPTHLALLLMIGTLKQVLSIPDIRRMLSSSQDPASAERLYTRFLDLQRDALRETSGLIRQSGLPDAGTDPSEGRERLRMLALELVVEARTRVLAAQRVLDMLEQADKTQSTAADPGKGN
ncbi:MAG: DUF1836 domain-containing protein [Clostridia bacterium]|nr:DUF1836 domain-containing protein [Clostridia bacterium]